MNIILYKLKDEVNDVKKTRTLSGTGLTLTGALRASTSKLTPYVEISQDINDLNDYNYAYIVDFKRYYFLSNPVSIRNGLTGYSLKVDVLTSFLTQSNLGNLEGTVIRTAKSGKYSWLIPDKLCQLECKPTITITTPTNLTPAEGGTVNTTFNLGANYNILICISTTSTPTTRNISVPVVMQALYGTTIDCSNIRPWGNYDCWITDKDDNSSTSLTKDFQFFMNYILLHDDWATAVYNIMVFPFELDKSSAKSVVSRLGNYLPDNREGTSVNYLLMYHSINNNSEFRIIADFDLHSPREVNAVDNYIMYEPYRKLEMFIPFVGWKEISIKENNGCRIMVYYIVDYYSGEANAYVYNQTKNAIIYQTTAQLGVQIAVNTTNMRENIVKDQNYTRNYITGLLTSLAIGVGGAVSGNAPMVIGAAVGAVSSYSQYVNNENLLIDRTYNQVFNSSGFSGDFSQIKVQLKWTKFNSVNFAPGQTTNIIKHIGLPCNQLCTLSELTDANEYHVYSEIIDLHTTTEDGIYSIADITLTELDELKKLCAQGIYL